MNDAKPPRGNQKSTLAVGTDGRTERTVRTRHAIVSAILDLVRAGNLAPTGEEIAQYARVGHRTVFRHFQDMESLLNEVNERVQVIVQEGLAETPSAGSLSQRIDKLVDVRARVFEQILMYYASAGVRSHTSPTVKRSRSQFARYQREHLLRWIPEAGSAIETIDLLTSVDGWLRLRWAQRLSVEQAKRALASSLSLLLTSPVN